MKILVTGASGFIGGRIVKHLHKTGSHELCYLLRKNLENDLPGTPLVGDLYDLHFLDNAMKGVDLVIHCAGLAGLWGSKDAYWKANVELTQKLLVAASSQKVKRWIQLSSPSISFEFKDQPNLPDHYAPQSYSSYYAESKHIAEDLVLAAADAHFKAVALRPRFVLGEGDAQIVPRMLKFLKKGFFPLIGTGNNLVDYTSIQILLWAIDRLIASPESAWRGIYNISSGNPVPFKELVSSVAKAAHLKHPKFIPIPKAFAMKTARTLSLVGKIFPEQEGVLHPIEVGVYSQVMTLDLNRLRENLGDPPSESLDETLADYHFKN